jgi:predicted regulator of Ras-like GTPase activity (Roadblock/LC7/MglB family)
MPVELPLKVIAPLFMMQHRGGMQKRVTVDEAIPNLFSVGEAIAQVQTQLAAAAEPPAAPVAPPTPAAPLAPAAPVAPATSFVAAPAPRIPAPTLQASPVAARPEAPRPTVAHATATVQPHAIAVEQVIGPAASRFGAKEIVANSAKLPGVLGVLLAMSDGLLVTSQAPAALKADTIAAFLPQMFGRMNQYTKELGLGALQRMALSVQGSDWQIFKAPNIYFAVLGKPGEALPLNLLAQVAAELSSQSN